MAERRRARMALRRTLMVSAGVAALAGLAACAQPGGGAGSTTPANDVVGGGGQIDVFYRQIYHPGSGTQF
jgi:hypothetical protein